MPTFVEAEAAVIRRLQAMPSRPPIIYPNAGNAAERPRLVVQTSAQTGRALTLDGVADATTEVVVIVEVAEGKPAAAAPIVSAICAHFALHTRFDGLLISQPPSPRPALQGDGSYFVPVVIRARHFI